jgi:hypothetical protein
MPNPQMRDARAAAAAKPPAPTPVFTTDANGNRVGDRPTVGPASADAIHAALAAQDQLAKAPRPVAQSQIGATPANPPQDSDNPTRDLSVQTAARRLSERAGKVNQAIDDASQ